MKAQEYLCGTPKFVRAILFNKTFNNNWLVTWHQDKTVAVSTKFERDGWGPWSIKDSTNHVQPPIEVLNYMITLRIHLDDIDEKNGCLKVIPKSHMLGILPQDKISEYTKKHEQVSCIGKRGSALVMRPHILHSSSKAINSAQRRVLHVEFSSYKLPEGVAWA